MGNGGTGKVAGDGLLGLVPIARIRTGFAQKFGVPRQFGLVEGLRGVIVMEKDFCNPDMVRGLEEFTHIWVIWGFSLSQPDGWSPTVRPPRLGGNERRGVFASRSPYRPNAIAMSALKILSINADGAETKIEVCGIDMTDGTPVYDIKPYIPYSDSIPGASAGFSKPNDFGLLKVAMPDGLVKDDELARAIKGILENDPRPAYHDDPGRVYAFEYDNFHISFSVRDGTATVHEITPVVRSGSGI